LKITEYLDYVFNEIDTNKGTLGVQDVFKHNDFTVPFKSPAVFCEAMDWNPGEGQPFQVFRVLCAVFVQIQNEDVDQARGKVVDIIETLQNLFETDPGVDEFPPDFSVEFGTAIINAERYYVAEVELTVEVV
jgi:hypothetical protein